MCGLVLAAGPLALAGRARAGAAPAQGETVVRVDVAGLRRVDPTVVEGQIQVRKGDPYRRDRVEADIKRILDLGLFSNVRAEAAPAPGGVVLTYTVFERRPVERVIFRGHERFSESDLLDAGGLKDVRYVDEAVLVRAAREIERRYHEEGYAFATASGADEVVDGRPTLVMTVREGPRVRVKAIEFRGVTAFTNRTLRSQMETRAYLIVLRRGLFREATVQADVQRVREYYLQQGYLDADVSYELTFNEDRTRVTVTVVVREGEPFHVGVIEVRGAKVYNAREITDAMSLKPGGRYTGTALAADREAVRRLYGRQGYLNAVITSRTDYVALAKNVVDLRLDIVEGQRITLAAVLVEGNRKTRTHVILRELTVEPGQVLNADKLDESRRSLEKLRYFKTVRLERLEGPDPASKDLVVEVTEDQTANIILGAGYGTETGLLGTVSYVQRNFDIAKVPTSWQDFAEGTAFAGAGQEFRLVASPGTELQEYLAEFREPHLFGSEYWLGVRAFLRERSRDDYDEGRLGTRVAVGRRLGRHWSAEVALRAEAIDISDIDPGAPADFLDVEGRSTLTSLALTVAHDTRNDWIDPSEGHLYSGTIEQAGVLGGDYTFTSFRLRGSWYVPVIPGEDGRGAHVLGLGARLGVIGGDAPIFERFYAGGTYTMRGFDYRGVGPHVLGFAVGGEFEALGSVEYSFPLVEKTFRGVVFLDVGTVEESVGFSTIRASAGVGLRVYLDPLGPVPMTFNFGFPIAKDEDDETQVFSFAIGAQL